jgi:chromate transporter
VVSLLGWRIAGMAGLLVATVATIGPSSVIAFFVGRGFTRVAGASWFPAIRLGLAPLVVGLYVASGISAARAADRGTVSVLITIAVAAYVTFSRHNPLWGLLAGAIVGGLAAGMGWL